MISLSVVVWVWKTIEVEVVYHSLHSKKKQQDQRLQGRVEPVVLCGDWHWLR